MESGGVFGGQLASDAATATTGVAHVPAGQAVCSELLEECYGAITLDRAPASDIRTGDHMVLVLITA